MQRRPGGGRPGDDDEDDSNAATDAHPRNRPPRRLPKQYNSDWNTIVEDADNTNLFFRIFNAPQQASTEDKNSILTQNKAKVRLQI